MDKDLRKYPDYRLFSPPPKLADRPPWEWTAREAKRHYGWFVSKIPERLEELRNVIGISDPELARDLDLSPKSLRSLGRWLRDAVVARPEEVTGTMETANLPADIRTLTRGNWTLTIESLSLCVDTGVYLGEVFCAHYGQVHWILNDEARGDVSFYEPVLQGFGRRFLDPVRETVGIARAMSRGERGADGLERTYRYWAERINL